MIDANGRAIEKGVKVRQVEGEIVAQVYYIDYVKRICFLMIVDEIRFGDLVKLPPDQLEVV